MAEQLNKKNRIAEPNTSAWQSECGSAEYDTQFKMAAAARRARALLPFCAVAHELYSAPYSEEPASPPSPEAQGLLGEPVLHSSGSHLFIFALIGKLSSASELTSVSISRLQPR